MTQTKAHGPISLVMNLHAPGMTILHRAGLGGLAATLRYIERGVKSGAIGAAKAPGGEWKGNKPPWKIEPTQISLDFGKPEGAEPFLKRLFALAFQIKDGLVHLPGQFPVNVPDFSVRVDLQKSLLLTFLQHGRVRKIGKESSRTYEVDGHTLNLNYRPCSYFKHQDGWRELCGTRKELKQNDVEVSGPLNPGAVVRHVAYNSDTKISDPPERILPLYFAIVGCLSLSINKGCGVLIVPETTDLVGFSGFRGRMTPRVPKECRITSAGDAALQAQLRLRVKQTTGRFDLPACQAFVFQPTPWASQQKSRVQSLCVSGGNDVALERFEFALAELPPRVHTRTVEKNAGQGKGKKTVEKKESFWVDSVVRPLIADNLALGRPWYQGFVNLVRGMEPSGKRPRHTRLFFEKEGLWQMTTKREMWEDRGEAVLVRAVHEAVGRRYGQIADENKNPVTRCNRWKGEYERWRLAFAGAKTPDQFRRALCDLLSRAPGKGAVKEGWQDLLPWLSDGRWELTRDLALLGLASYKGKGADEIEKSGEAEAPATENQTEA